MPGTVSDTAEPAVSGKDFVGDTDDESASKLMNDAL